MNWKNLILDLLEGGMTQSAIAEAIGVKQPTISDLLSGKQSDMRWQSGDKLVRLHRRRCRRAA